jgi:hypothetical protein
MRLNKNMAGEKISKAQVTAAAAKGSIDFDGASGEEFSGLNILKLEKGEAAGPFVLRTIKENQLLGKAPKKDKKDTRKPVTVYIATFNGKEVRMPIAAAFTMKAKDANLSIGDTFLVKRLDDYTSDFGTVCKGYALKVTERKK